jgi:hypothetical protein
MSRSPQAFLKWKNGLNNRLPAAGRHLLSFCLGLLMALVINYVVYRVGLPSKPFIYVAF